MAKVGPLATSCRPVCEPQGGRDAPLKIKSQTYISVVGILNLWRVQRDIPTRRGFCQADWSDVNDKAREGSRLRMMEREGNAGVADMGAMRHTRHERGRLDETLD